MFIIAAITFAAACGIMIGTWWNWIAGAILGVVMFIFLARIGEQRKSVFWRWLYCTVIAGILGFPVDYRLGIFVGTMLYIYRSLVSEKLPTTHRGSYGSQTSV